MNKTDRYIDIHAHILPGVDDGSHSMEETIQMLSIASAQNIGTIIATPHYRAGVRYKKAEPLGAVRDRVQAEADQYNIKLLLGNELYYSESTVSALKNREALTLAGSKYVLVEFSAMESYDALYRGIGELIRAGYAPVLAHVERYICLSKREERIVELVKSGCYIQMNCSSLIGSIFSREVAFHRKLVNLGLIHLIGSDCHDKRIRVPFMKDAVKILQKKCDKEIINRIIMENPIKVIENTYI